MLARKSRKNFIENKTEENNLLRAAGYIRLSVNKADHPSESIENQKKIIAGYSETNLDLQLEKFYIDDKASGRDFNRSAFNEMIEDIRAGKINCVIVKDLSRLGRSLIDVGYYVQMFFPGQKIRFISIANGIDTLDGMTNISFGKLPGDHISLTSLMDEQYAIDISKKTQLVLKNYIEEGKYVAPRAPYGYRKSDSDCHTLVPDAESAIVVKEIFSMAFGRISINEIVRQLNAKGIPTPISYAVSQGLKGNYNRGNGLWNSRTVKDILLNWTYVGDLEQGKDKHVVQNTHEPLVCRDVFDAVQQLISEGASISSHKTNAPCEDNILRGKVICGCCSSKMQRRKGSGNAGWYFFSCISNNRLGAGHCTGMYIRETDIINTILHEAKSYINNNEADSLAYIDRKAELEANAKQLEQKINEQEEASRSKYENFIMGIVDKEDYTLERNKHEALHTELQDINNQIKWMSEKHEQYLLFCNAFNDKGKIGQLVAGYILNVSVFANGKISVEWRDRLTVIASPRSNVAWYKDLDGFSLEKVNAETGYLEKAKLKVIYPFYQYGEYTEYAPESAGYYLPGTSVKGMLCQGASTPVDLMVDDIPIHCGRIVLRNLFKVQYLKDEQKACFDAFFENVGAEMIKSGTELTGEIYIRDKESAKALFYSANQSTIVKLKQMSEYLHECIQKNYSQDLLGRFYGVIQKMNPLLEDEDLFLLGGYKGLLHSMNIKEMENSKQKPEGAIYLDIETMLPHGLIKVELN